MIEITQSWWQKYECFLTSLDGQKRIVEAYQGWNMFHSFEIPLALAIPDLLSIELFQDIFDGSQTMSVLDRV